MRKRWLGAALLGACLGATATAQTPNPAGTPGRMPVSGPVMAAPSGRLPAGGVQMPEPNPLVMGQPGQMPPNAGMMPSGAGMMPPNGMPYGGMPPPNGMPQSGMPMHGMPPGGMPPQGPPPASGPLSYPMPGWYGQGPMATSQPAWYLTLGAVSLQRERMGNGLVAVRDPGTVDTGIAPPVNATPILRFSDMETDWMGGGKATIGYHWDNHSLELTGFYVPKNTSTHTIAFPRQIDSYFFNPPVGFEGNNFLWLQADLMSISLRTSLGSAELNYRTWWGPTPHFSWLIGVRYVDLWERLRIFTDDDGLTVRDSFGRPDATRQALYTVRTHNRIVAPQLGFEWNIPLNPWVAASMNAKGAWGANFVESDTRLRRGDGFTGLRTQRSETIFSHLYDAGFYLDWKLHQCAKLRTGWNILWLSHIAEAVEQVDFNLERSKGRRRPDGDVFYHGPTIELHMVF